MKSPESFEDGIPHPAARFVSTSWTVILSAKATESAIGLPALSRLCETYWYPLYAYVRRRGYDAHEAKDLTQEFFSRLLRRDGFGAVDPGKGRFRSFLIASMNHFLAKEWNRANRQKRGGGCHIISLQDDTAENRYQLEPVTESSPDRLFELRWAMTLLDTSIEQLRQEYAVRGSSNLFEELSAYLSRKTTEETYAQVASRLGVTENSVKVAIFRLRKRYGDLLRETIHQTVGSPSEVEEEIQHLYSVLGRGQGR